MMRCQICLEPDCTIDLTIHQPAPFTSVTLKDGSTWVNIPVALNWNWYCPEQDALWCWEDLLHETHPDIPEPAPNEGLPWCCEECGAAWPWFDPATAHETWKPGCPSCAGLCPECGAAAWPTITPSDAPAEPDPVRWFACLGLLGVPTARDGRVLSPDGVWSKRSKVWLYSHEPERPWAWRTKVGELLTLERRGDRLVGSGILRDVGLAERMFSGELRPAFEMVDVVVEGRTFRAGTVVSVRLTETPAWDEARFWEPVEIA